MNLLHATAFRVSLIAISLLVTTLSIIQGPDSGLSEFILLLLFYCPGSFFVLMIIASYRPSALSYYSVRILLFALAIVVASLGVVKIAVFLLSKTVPMGTTVAGALGACLLLVLMRACLAYRPRGLIGWVAPVVAGAISQLIAGLIGQIPNPGLIVTEIFWPALLWWWFVGEALLWQQRDVTHASNEPLERSRGAAS